MVNGWHLVLCLGLYVFYLTQKILRSPLRKFPGPLLASWTRWYKGYYDVVKDGGFLSHLEDLHRIYGPVVRTGPNELHFTDPKALDIYSVGSKFTKDPFTYAAFGQELSSFGTVDPHFSKARREVLNPLFSRRSILKLENVVQEKVDKLVSRILSYQGVKPCNMSMAFRSAALDIITSYCFAQSFDTLDEPDFRHPLPIAISSAITVIWTLKYFPFLKFISDHAPNWLAVWLLPVTKGYFDIFDQLSHYLDGILANPETLEAAGHETIYHHLLSPNKLHQKIPSKKSLLDESLTLLGAGSETVGSTVTMGVFHVLNNPIVYRKLVQELETSWPDSTVPMTYQALEKLPYLTSVIKESLRLGHGVVTPIPRVVKPTDVQIAGHNIPVDTIVGLGVTFVHLNPDLYPEPKRFWPERWNQPNAKELEMSYLVPFSRGPRMCLGVNLAWCELYLLFGNIFRKIDMEIHNTSLEDFEFRQHWTPIFRNRPFHAVVRARSQTTTE
ncbi:cytochrome P450 [Collybia nuda]|uniref:Cytochrome P450 n=1 Tax=Collybia nuda TaxID=64659 RepID=A0A9P5XZL7_9AGAR|nr:cytochrome P450 [Collybia nuda]